MFKKLKSNKDIMSIVCIIAFVCFTIFFFAPMEIYLSNKGYFFFGGEDVLPFAFLFFITTLAGSAFIFFILYCINKKIYYGFLLLFWSIGIALYIQGNFVVTDYGAMDGSLIDWSNYRVQGIISVIIFIGIIMITIILTKICGYQKLIKVAKTISICIILIQLVTIVVLLKSNNGLKKPKEYLSTCDGEMQLSKNENFIILMLDSFDSQAFSTILKDDNAQEYKDVLKDFTYYPDTLASFVRTDLAFPAIISGEYYRNDCTYGDYLNKAYGESPLICKLKQDDWFCGVYTTSLLPQTDITYEMDNCSEVTRSVSSHKRLAGYMYKFVGFRYLPQPLKKYCWFYPEDMKTSLECAKGEGVEIYSDDNFIFYDKISTMTAKTEKKVFQLYHLDGPHSPFTITKDFINIPTNFTNYEMDGFYDEARAMMILLDTFLNAMKENGTYDNSTIIIMADHGYLDLRQSPLLMVKGKNENHTFTTLKTKISYNDLQNAFQNILSGANTAEKIFPIKEDEARSRIFYYHLWNFNLGVDSHPGEITEYKVDGNAWNLNNIKKTGKVYTYTGN